MKISDITEGEVVQFPGMKKLSLLQAFGSPGINIIKEVLPNKNFIEKPDYFESIRNNKDSTIGEFELHRIQKAFQKVGIPLPIYTAHELFGTDNPKYPMVDAWQPDEKTFIVEFPSGKRFLADTTGAQSYIRMWMSIQ